MYLDLLIRILIAVPVGVVVAFLVRAWKRRIESLGAVLNAASEADRASAKKP